ncbi:hypothetical protein MKK69_04570 [Methylobacterium sp. J-026]|uniref:hypothetical protein n=1 Tax=Methylobacterium sp. J-026 TaxID=2836624 RepID=UPI001FBB4C56|nr:hypothetical protein [Methylobacterium sp. J-026]MCJ2133342.1 hypothetical protein [Methylobacterium sp. J-026]
MADDPLSSFSQVLGSLNVQPHASQSDVEARIRATWDPFFHALDAMHLQAQQKSGQLFLDQTAPVVDAAKETMRFQAVARFSNDRGQPLEFLLSSKDFRCVVLPDRQPFGNPLARYTPNQIDALVKALGDYFATSFMRITS